jgi:heptosyltransferase-2
MALPALRCLRERFPHAHITLLAKPWVAGLYTREKIADRVMLHTLETRRSIWPFAKSLRAEEFDGAILLQNAFEAALIVWLARIPRRIGYDRDCRGLLLTDSIPVPRRGEVPPHESYYYLELLHRAGILDALPNSDTILLRNTAEARQAGLARFVSAGFEPPVIGVSPGAAFGSAKRWLPERFAAAAAQVARARGAAIALFGSARERPLCQVVGDQLGPSGLRVRNFAGETTLDEFIELAAACAVFITNDSGPMHIAAAAGAPTVAVFGSTDHIATGPRSPYARIVREPLDCSPCKLRECPIDHRCMTRVSADRVAGAALELFK